VLKLADVATRLLGMLLARLLAKILEHSLADSVALGLLLLLAHHHTRSRKAGLAAVWLVVASDGVVAEGTALGGDLFLAAFLAHFLRHCSTLLGACLDLGHLAAIRFATLLDVNLLALLVAVGEARLQARRQGEVSLLVSVHLDLSGLPGGHNLDVVRGLMDLGPGKRLQNLLLELGSLLVAFAINSVALERKHERKLLQCIPDAACFALDVAVAGKMHLRRRSVQLHFLHRRASRSRRRRRRRIVVSIAHLFGTLGSQSLSGDSASLLVRVSRSSGSVGSDLQANLLALNGLRVGAELREDATTSEKRACGSGSAVVESELLAPVLVLSSQLASSSRVAAVLARVLITVLQGAGSGRGLPVRCERFHKQEANEKCNDGLGSHDGQ